MPPQRQRLTPWNDPLPKPGPVAIFDIDGVVANMAKYEYLIEQQRWADFAKQYGRAALIARGVRLVEDVEDAGLQVVWSTTRPEQAMSRTWRWLRESHLPQNPILSRHMIKDGSYRPTADVKLRHFFTWQNKYGERNPIVLWVDDDNDDRNTLRRFGCPAWTPMELQRAIVRSHGAPLTTVLAEKGPSAQTLQHNLELRQPKWQLREDEYQAKRQEWWRNVRKRAAEQRQARNRANGTPATAAAPTAEDRRRPAQ